MRSFTIRAVTVGTASRVTMVVQIRAKVTGVTQLLPAALPQLAVGKDWQSKLN